MDFRSPLIWLAPPAGLALACVGWFVLGGAGAVTRPIEALQARLDALPRMRPAAEGTVSVAFSEAAARPLFGGGAGGATEASVQVVGLSRTPVRSAALLSLNGEPAVWVEQGATVKGLTLVDVLSTRVVVESLGGRRTVNLGETAGPPTPDGPAATVAGPNGPPPGVRLPPEPASAGSQGG